MRKLMIFTIGFAAACIAGAYFALGNWLLLICGICLAAGLALCFCKIRLMNITAAILIGCAIGAAWNWGYQHFYLQDVMELDGKQGHIIITVTDYSYETDYGTAVDGKFSYADNNYRVKFYLYDCVTLEPGDQIESDCSFRYTAQGAKKDPTFHQGKGIFILAYGKEDYVIKESETQEARYFAVRLRRNIMHRIDALFPDDVEGLVKALLLGDSSDMSYEENTVFSISGIRHVIAVSGLHVSVLYSVISIVCLRKKSLIAIIGIPVLFIFAAVTGFTPTVLRACIMQFLIILSILLMKESDPFTSLAFSALVILMVNPISITDIGFQLSISCMIGIFGFSGRINNYIQSRKWAKAMRSTKLSRYFLNIISSSLSMSLSVWAITAPLCAVHFKNVSVVSVLTNLLTVWLINFIFCGIIIAYLLSLMSMPLGSAVAWLLAWGIRLVRTVAGALSGLLFSAVYTCSEYTVIWLLLCYVLIAVFVFTRYRRPGLLICCMLIGLCCSNFAAFYTEKQIENRVTILDVGNGQCVVLKNGPHYYLVDCGGGYDFETADIAAEHLLSRGINRIDGVILSHYDREHAGGLLPLMTRIEVGKLYLPDLDPDNSLRQEIVNTHPDKVVWIRDQKKIKDVNITMFCGGPETSGNEGGICVLFQPNNYDILILGDRRKDGELALMEQTDLPELELLIVGHHGGNGAASFEFLLKTRPQIAVISAGETDNRYPAFGTIKRLEEFGCQVLRTDVEGTIEFGR